MGIHQRLIECATPWAAGQQVKELRFGLGYSCVEMTDGRMGVAWTPDQKTCSCTHLEAAGQIAGKSAADILNWLTSDNALERTAGLAVFNALNARKERLFTEGEAASLLKIQSSDHVVMIGYFAPVVPSIKATGCRFEVVELDPEKPDVLSPEQGFKALAECDIAIITATTIINGTCDNLLAALKRNRAALILGPSTPMCPEAFAGTRVTQLSGSYVKDPEQVKVIISEGGGTRLLKKHLRFANTMV
ncbi:MAG: hypothetical protein CVV41_09490 [Candidatus Riflebacteria bacterium HGW-Riflebacteria-1]|jgi:hypothetical protein|nr:MAG: hypothetical protein CVV41_09490 [Candidatus Riflebacteria bacterium HGW-Riflebacteria-1]